MKRLSTRVLSFIIVLAMSVGLLAGFASAAAEWPGTPTGYKSASDVRYVNYSGYIANWGARGENCTFLPTYAQNYYTGSYTYASLSANAGGTTQDNATSSALYTALKSMLKAKQTKETTYNGTRDLFCVTDCVNGNYNYISSFYSGMKLNGEWGTGWNREHTWPNSKGNDNQDNDIMMLRPTSNEENSDRGNDAYGESSGYYDPNKESSSALNLHGDCARIVLYCYVRWENQSYMWGKSGVMESLNVLLKWMEEDPVDTWEMGRNDSVQSITGVRNVFVDYPELAWKLFGRDVPDGYVTPSGSMGGSETCNHVWNAGAVTTPANCTQPGVMTYTCTLCGRTKTESIPANGHSFVNGVCTVCGASQGAVYSLANTLNTGDEVVIYNAGNSKAVPATMKGSYYLDSVDIAAVNGVISDPDASIVWKATRNSDGTYTFKNGSDTLSINWDTESSKTSMSLDGKNPKIAADVCSAGNYSFYLRSATQTGKYGNIYLEWYASYTEFSAYDTTAARLTEKDFGFQFYVKGGSVAPTQPTEPTTAPTQPTVAPTQPTTAPTEPVGDGSFVLSSSIKGGDQVVIYNPGHGMAIKDENDNNWYLVPQAITPTNNRIYDPDAALIWTVVDNGNGTYSFTNGSHKIVCWVSGNYFELTNDPNYSGADGNWKVSFTDGLAYIQHASFSNSYGPAYIECYYNANKDKTNISGYSTSDPTAKSNDFGFQFFVKTGSTTPTQPTSPTSPVNPTTPTEPTTAPTEPTEVADGSFVLSSSIKGGDQVVIYNPGHGMAIKDENDNNWYLVPQAITPTNNRIYDPDASLIWTVVDNGNGTYSFTNGSDKIVCWVSGNYFELTNDASYSGADGNWKVSFTDGLAYIQHATFSNSYGPAYIECYYNASKDKTNISGYSTSNPTAKSNDFGFQFFVKTGSGSVTPTQPTNPTSPINPTTPTDPTAPPSSCQHSYVDTKVSATCTEPGYTLHTCTKCGESYRTDFTDLAPHSYVDGVCKNCGAKDPNYNPGGDEPIDLDSPLYASFVDLDKEAWYRPGIIYCLQHGLMNGVGRPNQTVADHFEPNGVVTRAMLVTIVYRAAGEPNAKGLKIPFDDVESGVWYTSAVAWAADNEIVKGVSEDKFAPYRYITREQLATILYRYAGEPEANGNLAAYVDAGKVSEYALPSMKWAIGEGIINGINGRLAPQEYATRAQIAAMMFRFLDPAGAKAAQELLDKDPNPFD